MGAEIEAPARPADGLSSVSAIVPFVNERVSIGVLVDALLADPRSAIAEVLIVFGSRTDADSLAHLRRLSERHGDSVLLHQQERPGLGGALREGVRRSRGSHCLFIFADLEADPASVPELVAAARRRPDAIVSASRWLPGGRFEGYGRGKLVLNLVFQKLMATLFLSRVTDFTFGYRVYPRRVLEAFEWREIRHPFVLESILAPIVEGVPVLELPTVWRRRREGRSSWRSVGYWSYLLTAWRLRVRGPAKTKAPTRPAAAADGRPGDILS